MSNSYKKICILGNTVADSEKSDKRIANRIFRRKNKYIIKNMLFTNEDNVNFLYDMNEVSDPWNFAKDGKSYYGIGDITKYYLKKWKRK